MKRYKKLTTQILDGRDLKSSFGDAVKPELGYLEVDNPMVEDPEGEWIKHKDVEKLIIRLTQGTEWNNPSLKPVNGKDCVIMLVTGEKHPAIMSDNGWVKMAGYVYDFEKKAIIKWRYNEAI